VRAPLAEQGIREHRLHGEARHGGGWPPGSRTLLSRSRGLGEAPVLENVRVVFDHAAQFFTVADPGFAEHVAEWVQRGWVREWDGCVGSLEPGGTSPPPLRRVLLPPAPPPMLPQCCSLSPSAHAPSGEAAMQPAWRVPTALRVLAQEHAQHAAGDSSWGRAPTPGAVVATAELPQGAPPLNRQLIDRRMEANLPAQQASHGGGLRPELRPGARYCAVGGMRHLCDALASRPCSRGWLRWRGPSGSPSMAFSQEDGAEAWTLVDEFRKIRPGFDFVVVAHNGEVRQSAPGRPAVPLVNAHTSGGAVLHLVQHGGVRSRPSPCRVQRKGMPR